MPDFLLPPVSISGKIFAVENTPGGIRTVSWDPLAASWVDAPYADLATLAEALTASEEELMRAGIIKKPKKSIKDFVSIIFLSAFSIFIAYCLLEPIFRLKYNQIVYSVGLFVVDIVEIGLFFVAIALVIKIAPFIKAVAVKILK
jgi:hypothetical protein